MSNTINSLQTLNETINTQVDSSLGSLFTKDDVKNVINGLFEKVYDILNEEVAMPTQSIDESFFDAIKYAVDNMDANDFYRIDNPRFSIDYGNELSLDDYDVDFNSTSFAQELIDLVKEKVSTNVSA